jgi:AcrR family transcriptional regulator
VSPRPRKVSDDDVFAATYRVMQRVRPGDLTLAAIGAEAGITAAALVQRFGSRQGLLRALNARFAEGGDEMYVVLRARHASPLAAIRAFAQHFAGIARTPASLAHHLAWLEMDLSDPATHAGVAKHARAARAMLEQWVREAVAAGEMRPDTDPSTVARVVHTTVAGSMMSYPFFRSGTPEAWLRADVDLVLAPYLIEP